MQEKALRKSLTMSPIAPIKKILQKRLEVILMMAGMKRVQMTQLQMKIMIEMILRLQKYQELMKVQILEMMTEALK